MRNDILDQLILHDPDIRDFYLDDTPDDSHGAVWSCWPAEMYVRLWPENDWEDSFNGRFRGRCGKDKWDLSVSFNRLKHNIPLNSTASRLWDEIRTDLALDRSNHWAVWTGQAHQPHSDLWDQNHVFFLLRDRDNPAVYGPVISFHYDTISFQGHWTETEQYRDWRMNSRKYQTV